MSTEDPLSMLLAAADEILGESDQVAEKVSKDPLDELLSAATKVSKQRVLQEVDIFEDEVKPEKSVIHSGDTDSSDDEGNRNCAERKYNEYGREIKSLLSVSPPSSYTKDAWKKTQTSSWTSKPNPPASTSKPQVDFKPDVYTDPFFGIRMINPQISSTMLQERMTGRVPVHFAKLNYFLMQNNYKDKDWVIAGVIVNKSNAKMSQKGSQYSIWTLSDLHGDIKTVALFLFSSAHSNLWKTTVGSVVGVLNPNVLDKKDGSKDLATLSVDNSQKVMIFGQSKDLGVCKSMKKNGEKCTAIVNTNRCEFCVYHIKQEYQKCSRRSELQANFSGRGLTALRNKVLGKNEVFYAGKSYTAIPAKKSKKMEQKDNNRLLGLSGKAPMEPPRVQTGSVKVRKQNAARLDVSPAQRLRDLELLKKLGGASGIDSKNSFSGTQSGGVSMDEAKKHAIEVINKLKAKKSVPEVSQYDMRSDLTVNIDTKTNFEGKASGTVTLDQSRCAALELIAKMKSNYVSEESDDVGKGGGIDMDEFFNNDIEFDYDDLVDEPKENAIVSSKNGRLPEQSMSLSNNLDQPKSTSGDKRKDASSTKKEKNVVISAKSEGAGTPKVHQTLESFGSHTTRVSKDKVQISGSPIMSKKDLLNNVTLSKPKLTSDAFDMIDLSKPANKAKLKAIQLVQKTGPIQKADPNNVRGSGKKRALPALETDNHPAKKSKLAESEFISDRFKKMMAATSKHLDLLAARDEEEKEKYFNKLEVKERMEEKMASTYKVPCKAVRCLQCKYTSFSSSDLCKRERHPLRVFDATKRFFKCGNCQNRIACLEFVPTRPCTNCGGSKWEKTTMMKEKIVTAAHTLSIRGGEQKFVNSTVTDTTVDLLVPESD